jgi:hypothetical protein
MFEHFQEPGADVATCGATKSSLPSSSPASAFHSSTQSFASPSFSALSSIQKPATCSRLCKFCQKQLLSTQIANGLYSRQTNNSRSSAITDNDLFHLHLHMLRFFLQHPIVQLLCHHHSHHQCQWRLCQRGQACCAPIVTIALPIIMRASPILRSNVCDAASTALSSCQLEVRDSEFHCQRQRLSDSIGCLGIARLSLSVSSAPLPKAFASAQHQEATSAVLADLQSAHNRTRQFQVQQHGVKEFCHDMRSSRHEVTDPAKR